MIKLNQFGVEKQYGQLKNGVRILNFRKKGAPIDIKFVSKSGSRFDPDNKTGLAHLVEHAVFNGTENYRTKKELAQKIDDMGGHFFGSTSYEYISFDFVVADREDLKTVLDIASGLYSSPLFLDNKIATEKDVIHTEALDKANDPTNQASLGVRELMFGKGRLSINPLGTPETIVGLTREDIVNHHTTLLPNDLIVVGCGDIAVDEIERQLENRLPFKTGMARAQIKPIELKNTGALHNDSDLACIEIGFPTVSLTHKDRIPIKFLCGLLGVGKASLLKEKIRTDKGLVYTIVCGSESLFDCGYLYIRYKVKKEYTRDSVEKVRDVLKQVKEETFGRDAIMHFKNKVLKSTKIDYQTSSSIVNFHFYNALADENGTDIADFLNGIESITADDLVQTANKYLNFEKMCIYGVGNLDENSLRV